MREKPEKYWDYNTLKKAPAYRDANFPDSEYKGLRAILFDGAEVEGKKAPVFAYLGIPEGQPPKDGFPGIVLIHGGGGTAFGWAVDLWVSYGYAVIAIDWYNQRPTSRDGKGRAPLDGGERQNHVVNVANMVLANSLLRSIPEVNKDKIGFVGLSWGSWYGAMVAAVDPRLKCVIEIYCGNCGQSNKFINGRFLHAAKVPMYWIAGTNDINAPLWSLQLGFKECANFWNKSLIVQLPHSHEGFRFKACRRVADYFLREGRELPKLGRNQLENGIISAPILKSGRGIRSAILCYTLDPKDKPAHLRKWSSIPAEISGNRVSAKLPENVFQCFLSVYDEEDLDSYCCGSGDLCQPVSGK